MFRSIKIILVFALIFLTTTSAFCFGFGTKWMKKYETMKVVDADTGEPIEGAWVVVKWKRESRWSFINPGGVNWVTTKIIELETDKKGEFHPFKSKWKYGSSLRISAWKKGYTLGGPPCLTVSRTRGLYSMSGSLKSLIIKLKKLPEWSDEYGQSLGSASISFEETKWENIVEEEATRCRNIREKNFEKQKKEQNNVKE